ncbi:hypothetical protein ACFVYR_01070, partial [Streptomyces sp. NPDC058284]|uniref:hypothetical protein n=1 Tax=Streptomyces sp. NPDC058284 TaxID=3346421 RepID=UPI0036EEDA9B
PPPSRRGAPGLGVLHSGRGRPGPTNIALVDYLYSNDLVDDAIEHPGPADSGRIDRAHCAEPIMPLNSAEAVNALPGLLNYPVELLIHSQPWADAEPPLRDYAR